MSKPTCATCRSVQKTDDPKIGFCHRFPPQVLPDGRSSTFPAVALDTTWCDEHRPEVMQ